MNNNFEINVSLIIRYQNSIIIAKRSNNETFFPGFWGIPGGMVELTDKSLKEAINRECLEEIGINFNSNFFELVSENIIVKNQKPKLYLTFFIEIFEEPLLKKGPEVDEIRIETYDNLKGLQFTPFTLELIEKTLQQ
jgi:ADP-ribose pyrophosphatase YjhB (NUDIX family)